MLLRNLLYVTFCSALIITTHCQNAGNYTIGVQEIEQSSDPFIVVIVPSYNNKAFYTKNLDSICMQDYHRYHVIYTDDASPDGTGQLVQEYIQDNNLSNKITLIKNKQRVGALANTYAMAHMCHPKSIVIVVDGDDWLAHSSVLSYLAEEYRNPDTWLTYGQFQWLSSCSANGWAGLCEPVPKDIIANGTIREYKWVTSAPRTFYAQLFHLIDKNDLLYEGNFFSMTGDLAYMFPMIEMAGFHIKFIPKVLYVYNFKNPINDGKVNLQKQLKFDRIIRKRKRYQPLKMLLS